MFNQQNPNPQKPPLGEIQSRVPYEEALVRAFDKLTSQVLVFLLGWGIILIILATIKPDISIQLLASIYFLSALGVAVYVWQEKRSVVGQGNNRRKRVRVRAGRAEGSTYVSGTRGAIPMSPDDIDVRLGRGKDNARVIGLDAGEIDSVDSKFSRSNQENYLIELFRQLEASDRRELVRVADDLLKKDSQET